jgi:hypothetical protein
MLVSSTAPLPNNSLTPIPQSWVDARNLQIGLLSAKAAYAASITSCYAPANSFIDSVGPYTAQEVASTQATSGQVASDLSGATIPNGSGSMSSNGPAMPVGGGRWAVGRRGHPKRLMPAGWTPGAPGGSGANNGPNFSSTSGTSTGGYANMTSEPLSPTTNSITGPPPTVMPYNIMPLNSPGFRPQQMEASEHPCGGNQQSTRVLPQMLMPKMFPNLQRGTVNSGMSGYSPGWGSARRGGSCASGGLNWGGLLLAFAVGFGLMAVMDE